MVRIKFFCNYIEEYRGDKSIAMHAETTGEDKNPEGGMDFTIVQGHPAIDFFEVGKYYYIDISEATEE